MAHTIHRPRKEFFDAVSHGVLAAACAHLPVRDRTFVAFKKKVPSWQ
jgi:hypothetical protein